MMTAEQLKNSILQLAMQGKLVEQRQEEGTGEELYKEIQIEKKKLIKEGKVKKQKDLSPITEESAPFEIPETWKWINLGEIIDYRMGKTPPRAETVYWGNDIFWVSIADMVDGKIITETKEKISHKALAERFNDQISPKGTLIMSFKLTVGRVSILGMDAVHNEAIISIFPFINTDDVLRDYLKTMLPFLSVYGESKKAIKGFTLNSTSLNQIPVPLPPLAEQKRIVEKIEELMPFVEQYATASTKLNTLNTSFPEMMKKSILQEAVQGKLVPQDPNDEPASLLLKKIAEEKKRLTKEGKIKKQRPLPEITEDEIPFDILESWEWIRIGMVTDVKGGKRVPKGKSVIDSPTPHIYIRVTDMKNQTIVSDKIKYITEDVYQEIKQYTINKEDLYLTIAGTIGAVGVVPDMFDGMNLTENAVKLCNILIYKDYLLRVIQSPLVQAQFVDRTNKVAQPKLAIVRIESTLIPLPPLEEQKRIVEMIDKLMLFIDGLDG